ncbi:MAG TPA: response regulator [Gammaproteobacteria bacterium]|nr:response regulator [Gammaproteobacteria bacterium]
MINAMTLRRQILLFLLLFGLAPLTAVMLLNMPMIMRQAERFYHEAHLQNLRADFRDIDEHIASRKETVRLLAKLPDPGMLRSRQSEKGFDLAAERDLYLAWLDRVLRDQLDITNIAFLDPDGGMLWQLTRDPKSGSWREDDQPHDPLQKKFFQAAIHLPPGRTLPSPIHHNEHSAGPDNLYLRLASPVYEYDFQPPVGLAVISVDIRGLAHAYRQTYWVFHNGDYLSYAKPEHASASAFEDFPGLDKIFTQNKAALWNPRDGDPVIWIPMFPTTEGKPLWVGRRVDPSPVTAFKNQIFVRVLVIIAALVLAVMLAAHFVANKIEQYQQALTRGLRQTLAGEARARVPVKGPRELREMANTLNQLADQHVRNNQALRRHADELERSNRYKSQFLANVSHELRTPLNSVLLLSKMLLNDDDPPLTAEQKQQALVIHKAGADLKAMIDNILDLSRIEARRCAIVSEPVNLPELLRELEEIVAPQFKDKGLDLTLRIDEDAIQDIHSDSEKIGQIIKNFLANALKFTDEGGVTVRLSRADDAQQPVSICVSDTGRGIPPHQQQHIFEAFQQADGSTNRRYGGAGLGLTISRELSRLLGGRISLKSEAGKGAEFCLRLPQRIEASEAEMQLETAPQPATEPPPQAAPATDPELDPGLRRDDDLKAPSADLEAPPAEQRALIVESDLKALLALTAQLEKQGFQVTGALDEAEALENLQEESYDIILANAQAATAIRRNASGQIIVHGEDDDTGLEDLPHLPRPATDEQLRDLLARLAGRNTDSTETA